VTGAALSEAYVRITVTRGPDGAALAPAAGGPTVVIAALPVEPLGPAGDAIAAELLRGARGRRAAAKSTSWQPAEAARRLVRSRGAEEGLYVSARGRVLEGVCTNVFAVVEDRLLTPPAHRCLPGITRGRVLELARAHGVDVVEAPLALETLRSAQEAFVTNAVRGLRALAAIDGEALARQGPEGVFATLHRLYARDRAGAPTDDRAGAPTDDRAGAPAQVRG